jgi:hypothetical protein
MAKRRVSKQVTTIPGMIDTTVMIKTGKDLGMCHVCDTSRIIWWDEEQHLGLCDQCYEREVQVSGKIDVYDEYQPLSHHGVMEVDRIWNIWTIPGVW